MLFFIPFVFFKYKKIKKKEQYLEIKDKLPTMTEYEKIETFPDPIKVEYKTAAKDDLVLYEFDIADVQRLSEVKVNSGRSIRLPRFLLVGSVSKRKSTSAYDYHSVGGEKLYLSFTNVEIHTPGFDNVAKLVNINRVS